jgi:hypothetical protein
MNKDSFNKMEVIKLNIMKKRSSGKSSSNSSRTSKKSVFLPEIFKESKVKKIQEFLRSNLIINKYKLDKRVSYLNYIKKKLIKLLPDDCLDNKMFGKNNGFTIRNIINLEKKIGSDGYNGEIYKTSIPTSFGTFPIATKIMEDNKENNNEVYLMKLITEDIIINKKSKHFPIMYKSCLCKNEYYPKKQKLICLNEIANGDLKSLLDNRVIINDKNILFNILFQVFISIGTFQNYLNRIHNDCHSGNFLWNYNNEKGYYHYIFNKKSYYIKSCKYNIMIHDYGYSNIIKSKKSIIKILSDYAEIIPVFSNEEISMSSKSSVEPSEEIKKELYEIIELLMKERKSLKNKYSMSSSSPISESNPTNNREQLFEYIIENILIPYSPKDMFITSIPDNVINKIPFYIDK